ncbi:MAG: aminopeptidase N, partial [Sedimenticola sp.]
MLHENSKTIYLKDYLPPEYLIDQVDLHFDLGEAETRVRAQLTMRRNPKSLGGGESLHLDGEQLELLSLRLNDKDLGAERYRVDDEGLTIFQVPDQFTLESEVRVKPQENTALEGLYKSGGMFCT